MTIPEPMVFVVDDDLAMRESLCWLISSIDLPVKAFSSAREFPPVATVEGRPRHRQARDGRRLAPPGVPPILEMEIVPRKAGSPANLEGNTRTHPANEPREPALGCSAHPWRVAEARLRCLAGNRNKI